jgi:hypothetical protein
MNSTPSKKNKPYGNNDQPHNENENRNTVDAVHVLHPSRMRGIGVPLFEIKVFCQLP